MNIVSLDGEIGVKFSINNYLLTFQIIIINIFYVLIL